MPGIVHTLVHGIGAGVHQRQRNAEHPCHGLHTLVHDGGNLKVLETLAHLLQVARTGVGGDVRTGVPLFLNAVRRLLGLGVGDGVQTGQARHGTFLFHDALERAALAHGVKRQLFGRGVQVQHTAAVVEQTHAFGAQPCGHRTADDALAVRHRLRVVEFATGQLPFVADLDVRCPAGMNGHQFAVHLHQPQRSHTVDVTDAPERLPHLPRVHAAVGLNIEQPVQTACLHVVLIEAHPLTALSALVFHHRTGSRGGSQVDGVQHGVQLEHTFPVPHVHRLRPHGSPLLLGLLILSPRSRHLPLL